MTDPLPRALKVAKVYKRLLLDPRGTMNADGKEILRDLALFCYAAKPICMRDATGRIDPLATQQAIGRQEVYLRIAGMLALDPFDTLSNAHQRQAEEETQFPG